MDIRGVVFDLDRTLYDRKATNRVVMASFWETHRDLFCVGRDEAVRALEKIDSATSHKGWPEKVAALDSEGIFFTPPEPDEMFRFFQQEIATEGILYPDTVSTLVALRAKDLALGIITNGDPYWQNRKIDGLGLRGYFDEILVVESAIGKPGRVPFAEMANRLLVPCPTLLYVGDDPLNDVEGSRNAGYIPVWMASVPWDRKEIERPDHAISALSQLPDLVDRLRETELGAYWGS